MTAEYSNYATNYANFRIFSETLHADILDAEFSEGMMNFRESHRGTMTGMTRFRSVIDDMPILGYGWSAVSHDRVESFHRILAGHSANYLSRGAFWGTEQRLQLGVQNFRSRNGGSGGEYGSLCMVSAIPVSMWVRWMLIQEDFDEDTVFVARAAPTSWFQGNQSFSLTGAPTRFGIVSFTIEPSMSSIGGSISLKAHPNGVLKDATYNVRIPAGQGRMLDKISAKGADFVSFDTAKEMATFKPSESEFSFTATFKGTDGDVVFA